MALPVYVEDGEGTKRRLRVLPDGSILVSSASSTSQGKTASDLTAKKQYRGFLEYNDSESLAVVGSLASPVVFALEPVNNRVLFITSIRVLMHSEDMEIQTNDFRRFGTAATSPGLTNGLLFYIEQSGIQTNLLLDPIKTIGDFMDYADDFTNFVNAIASQTDFLSFDFIFDVPVVLVPGSTDSIKMEVRDDLSSIELFNVICRGYQEVIS